MIAIPLLLLLSRFSRVQLCATQQTAANQAPPSLGFSRQEHWSVLPFLLQCMKVKSESEVVQSCLTLSDPMDCSLPGSSVHGIFQARVLESYTSNTLLFRVYIFINLYFSTYYQLNIHSIANQKLNTYICVCVYIYIHTHIYTYTSREIV